MLRKGEDVRLVHIQHAVLQTCFFAEAHIRYAYRFYS